jgi:D-psicose/D-tagatose/L-ribulose 3-epimerase
MVEPLDPLAVDSAGRGAPGHDHIDWPAVAAATLDTGYGGPFCIESFTAENRTIATAASIWRPLERSQDAIATDGLAHLRRVMAEAAAAHPVVTGARP